MDVKLKPIASLVRNYKEHERLIFEPIFKGTSYFQLPCKALFAGLWGYLIRCSHARRKKIGGHLDASIESRMRCADILKDEDKMAHPDSDFYHENIKNITHRHFLLELKRHRQEIDFFRSKTPHRVAASSADVYSLPLPHELRNESSSHQAPISNPPSEDVQAPLVSNTTNSINSTEKSGHDTTLNDIEISQLSQVINIWIDRVTVLWTDAMTRRIRFATAISVTCCMFQDIVCYFAAASLISENNMFDTQSPGGNRYPFEEEFKTVQNYQRFGPVGVTDQIYRGILEEITKIIIMSKPPQRYILGILPPFVSCLAQLKETFLSVQESGASRLGFCLSLRLLGLVESLAKSHMSPAEIEQLRNHVWLRFNHFGVPLKRDFPKLFENNYLPLRPLLKDTSLLSLICHIDSKANMYRVALFESKLKEPFVIQIAHLYVRLRMENQIVPNPRFEWFCKSYGSKLFKYQSLPSCVKWTKDIADKWYDCFATWISVECDTQIYKWMSEATHIQSHKIKARQCIDNLPRSVTMLRHDFKISSENHDGYDLSEGDSFERLKLDLEAKIAPPNFQDFDLIFEKVIDEREHSGRELFCSNRDSLQLQPEQKDLFDCIASRWEQRSQMCDQLLNMFPGVQP